ncbi:MAG: 2-dehydro-3-deoxygalactonokinase, partial [Ginsengibacter sp.]
MQKFISCDWGTSTLRLRFVDATGMMVLAETEGSEGISQTFNLWKQSGRKEDGRLHFYQSILKKHIVQLEEQLNFSLPDMPLIISGMASSTIGMMELPYKEVPFSIDGHDLVLKTIEESEDFRHPILMISGVRTANDVMRGEETQLTGCLHSDDEEDQIFIFPGTHSKHVSVKKK